MSLSLSPCPEQLLSCPAQSPWASPSLSQAFCESQPRASHGQGRSDLVSSPRVSSCSLGPQDPVQGGHGSPTAPAGRMLEPSLPCCLLACLQGWTVSQQQLEVGFQAGDRWTLTKAGNGCNSPLEEE